MNYLNLEDFKKSIKSFDNIYPMFASRSKKDVWVKIIGEECELVDTFEKLIEVQTTGNDTFYIVSKNDVNLFYEKAKKGNKKEKYLFFLSILIWGYPKGGRGNHIKNIFKAKEKLLNIFLQLKESNKYLLSELFELYINSNYRVKGLGPSTLTKIFYFMNCIDKQGIKACIMDEVMLDIFNRNNILEVKEFFNSEKITKLEQKSDHYQKYCEFLSKLAKLYSCKVDSIEDFLYYIVRNLQYK